MASGNSWQVYQELGNVPSEVFEALKQLPQGDPQKHDRRRRRMTSAGGGPISGARTLVTSPSANHLQAYMNDAYYSSSGGERSPKLELRRSHSQPRFGHEEGRKGRTGDEEEEEDSIKKDGAIRRRNSMSIRVAKEKGRQLWKRARTFLDVTVLPNLYGATVVSTPPPSPGRRRDEEEDDDEDGDEDSEFMTASDLSGLRMIGRNERDGYEQIAKTVHLDRGNREEAIGEAEVELYRRRGYNPECPVHGHRRRTTEQQQHRPSTGGHSIVSASHRRSLKTCSFDVDTTILDDDDDDDDEFATRQASTPTRRSTSRTTGGGGGPASSNFMLKLARRRHKAALNNFDRHRVERERSKILRNLFTLSVAFLFLISAFQGLQNLQTTIHGADGLGAISLSVLYSGLVISCLFTPPYLLNRIGCKLTLVLSICTFSIYMLTHFMPKWYSLLPGSLLVGFGAAPLWAAKCSYLSEAGFRYAELNLESSNVVIVRFFGVFFMIVHMGQVFGNLISSWILRAALGDGGGSRGGLASVVEDRVDETCGHYFPTDFNLLSDAAKTNLARPPPSAVYSLCAVYFCCTLVAALIIAMFLNQLRRDLREQREKPYFKLDIWRTTIEQLKKPRHFLLVPLTIFNGMQQAFIAGEFTKVYVGCCLGITHIGYVMMSFGLFDAICSLVFGPLIKLFGRMPLLMFGAIVDMLMIFTLLVWPPNPADTDIFYVVAACWGMADGVWNTQINGLWVVIFADNLAAAFANYRLWESVGFIIAFAYTPFLSTETKLYILLAMLWIGMLGYGLIELWEPLEDYVLNLKEKLQASIVSAQSKMERKLASTKEKRKQKMKKRQQDKDEEAKIRLLTDSLPRGEKLAPLAVFETDF